jgi:hypothetical protein
MKDFFLVLIGGICSTIGGCIAIWYQAKKARQIRMEEIRGEQQIEAWKKGLSLTDRLWDLLVAERGTTDDAIKVLRDNGEWFSMNQILLPHTFVENWRSVILNLCSIKRQDEARPRISDGAERDEAAKAAEQIRKEEKFVKQLVKQMDEVLRRELGLKEVNIKRPDDKEKEQ